MIRKIIRFYAEGFRQMKLGRTLWAIIGIKLFVMFAILKVFFFPDTLAEESRKVGVDCSEYVANEFVERSGEAARDTVMPQHEEELQSKFQQL